MDSGCQPCSCFAESQVRLSNAFSRKLFPEVKNGDLAKFSEIEMHSSLRKMCQKSLHATVWNFDYIIQLKLTLLVVVFLKIYVFLLNFVVFYLLHLAFCLFWFGMLFCFLFLFWFSFLFSFCVFKVWKSVRKSCHYFLWPFSTVVISSFVVVKIMTIAVSVDISNCIVLSQRTFLLAFWRIHYRSSCPVWPNFIVKIVKISDKCLASFAAFAIEFSKPCNSSLLFYMTWIIQ